MICVAHFQELCKYSCFSVGCSTMTQLNVVFFLRFQLSLGLGTSMKITWIRQKHILVILKRFYQACCLECAVQGMFSTVCCPRHVVMSLLSNACCREFVVHGCPQSVAQGMLSTVCCPRLTTVRCPRNVVICPLFKTCYPQSIVQGCPQPIVIGMLSIDSCSTARKTDVWFSLSVLLLRWFRNHVNPGLLPSKTLYICDKFKVFIS